MSEPTPPPELEEEHPAEGDPAAEEQAPPERAESIEDALLAAEVQLGGDDPKVRAANDALRALARASRSYLIYDPRNDAIRDFLHAVKEAFEDFQRDYHDMLLAVRPFELVLEGRHTVYIERDRERSLAFKLYRDGVRKLVIQEGVTWHELTQLLGILSIRYVGIRQNPAEDDIVTLLWKAGFQHVNIEAVEGFVPDDDDLDIGVSGMEGMEGFTGTGSKGAAQQRIPHDFDLPEPELPEQPVTPTFQAVSPDVCEALLDEEATGRLPETVLTLIGELLDVAEDPTEPLGFDDISHLIRECRDFLLAEDQLDVLLTMFRDLAEFREAIAHDEDTVEGVDRVMAGFVDERALGKLVDSVPVDAVQPPPTFYELLELVPTDPFESLLKLLEQKRSGHARRFTRQLIEHYLPERTDDAVRRYHASVGGIAADLLRVLSRGNPEAAQSLIAEVVRGNDLEVQLEFLQIAERVAMGPHMRSFLLQLLNAQDEEIRLRTLDMIIARGERGAFRPVLVIAQRRAKFDCSDRELAALGRALAKIAPNQALSQFNQWCKQKSLFKKLVAQDVPLQKMAIGGLEHIDHEAAEAILRSFSGGDEVLLRAARNALRNRQRRMSGAAPRAEVRS